MNSLAQQKNSLIVPGKKYRFEARTAEEAVATIKERMGPNARVLEVKQMGGEGLARFIRTPKLEIIASVPLPEVLAEEAVEHVASIAEPDAVGRPKISITPPIIEEPVLSNIIDEPVDSSAKARDTVSFNTVIRRMGFDDALLAGFEGTDQWAELEKLPLRKALAEFSNQLFQRFQRYDVEPTGKRVAFIGTPGTGKTTALCKRLTSDVFMEGRSACVVKLESETPNSSEALSAFTQVLGVRFAHEGASDSETENVDTVYYDVPGMSLSDDADWTACGKHLDTLEVDTRVLVMNAAYDAETIKATIAQGMRIGATHTVFTHLDEVRNPGRIWRPVFGGGLSPLFLSESQSVTEAPRNDIFSVLLETTFPRTLFT